MNESKKIIVVGGGIVGVSCALFLQRDGHHVTIVDPAEPGTMTSFGNAGSLSMSSVLPTAMPGLWKKLPKMLLDSTGPLNVRWQYLPRLLPFLLAFLRNTAPERVEANGRAIAALIHGVMDAYNVLVRETSAESLIRRNGALKVYETDASFAAAQFERDALERNDCNFEILNADELGQLEPGLEPIFKYAMFLPESGGATNPGRLVKHFTEAFVANGGEIVSASARDFTLGADKAVLTDGGGRYQADHIVLAAGPWSGQLAAKLGAPVRLEAERGYHIMLPTPPVTLNRFTYFADRQFVLTPHEEGLRLTTGVEYAKVDAPPDYRRIRGLLPQTTQVMRNLDPTEQSIWCGNRPTLPDSVPVIGPAPNDSAIFLAFGHSHLGLTMGPVTGRIIADLVAGRDPGVDLTPYRPNR
ncbi:MAG: FAD-binding oxidoreductase [Pseudomonadota bacterium]